MELRMMEQSELKPCAALFARTFNGAPWYEHWTQRIAEERLSQLMNTTTFLGMVLEEEGVLLGLICGQREAYYTGPRFQIQEFCVDAQTQGKGCGTMLLDSLTQRLAQEGIYNLCLLTQHGEATEGYYQKRGFVTESDLVWMSRTGRQEEA